MEKSNPAARRLLNPRPTPPRPRSTRCRHHDGTCRSPNVRCRRSLYPVISCPRPHDVPGPQSSLSFLGTLVAPRGRLFFFRGSAASGALPRRVRARRRRSSSSDFGASIGAPPPVGLAAAASARPASKHPSACFASIMSLTARIKLIPASGDANDHRVPVVWRHSSISIVRRPRVLLKVYALRFANQPAHFETRAGKEASFSPAHEPGGAQAVCAPQCSQWSSREAARSCHLRGATRGRAAAAVAEVQAEANPFRLSGMTEAHEATALVENTLDEPGRGGGARSSGRSHPLLQEAAREFFERRERAFRPAVVLLVARAVESTEKGKPVSARQCLLAEIVEMMCTATIVHDSVLEDDEESMLGNVAHRTYSQNAGNKVSVLAGDFLLARCSVALSQLGDLTVVELMATALESIVQGGVLKAQARQAGVAPSLDDYQVGSAERPLNADASRSAAILAGSPR